MDSKEKEISLHRLSKEDEERIYDLIDSKLMVSPSDTAAANLSRTTWRGDSFPLPKAAKKSHTEAVTPPNTFDSTVKYLNASMPFACSSPSLLKYIR